MRKYVRHPSSIPIEISIARVPFAGPHHLNNIATGGFACTVREALPVGCAVQVRIPSIWPDYRGCGIVRWCREFTPSFEVGVEFSAQDMFKAKMVEQLCQIEQYRQRVYVDEGRIIDGEQAAVEWIALYAHEFSDAFQSRNSGNSI